MNVVNLVCILTLKLSYSIISHNLFIIFFLGQKCCVKLKANWHDNGVSIGLLVRPAGYKDYVDISEADNIKKKSL